MYAINAKQLIQIIHDVCIDMNSVIAVWGGSGGGKSQITGQAAKLYKKCPVYTCDVRAGQNDTVDLKGLPDRIEIDGKRLTMWNMASMLPFKNNPLFDHCSDGIILLILDEFDHGMQGVKGMMYQVLAERRLGEEELRDNVRIITIRNRPKDKGVSGGREPEPLNRRQTHFEYITDLECFCDYISDNCERPNYKGLTMGRENASLLIAFLNWQKSYLDTYDPEKPEISVGCGRTWEDAGCFLNLKDESVKAAAIAGAVGDGRGDAFRNFIALKDKILPISRILKDPLGVPLPEAPDIQYMTTVSVSGSMNLKTITPLYKFMCRLSAEFVVLAWQLALKRDKELYETNEFLDFTKTYKAVFSR